MSDLVARLLSEGTQARLIVIGKKAGAYYRFRGLNVEGSYAGFVDRPTYSDARRIAAFVGASYFAGEAQQVLLVSTRYVSAGSQAVETRQLLPLVLPDLPVEEEPHRLKG